MASTHSHTTTTTLEIDPAEKSKNTVSNLSPEKLPQIKVVCQRQNQDLDNVSNHTDETGTGTDDVSTERDDTSTRTDDPSTGTDDASTGTDDESTGTEDTVYAPEGGWGWMVTLSGFVVAFIVDGILATFGLMIPELLATFDTGMSVTSLPPAILGGMYQLLGPVTAYLVQRWGCRGVGMCGGLLAAVGVGASAFAPSIHLFILSFGFLAGVGVGLIYLPSITMVNLYFHKKRGMVAGIITSGSGFGLLALAPLTEMLMAEYGWRGCYLIMAAITLHFCVCASLMRPLPPRPPPSPPSPSTKVVDGVVVVEGKGGNCHLLNSQHSLSLVNVQELKESDKDAHHVALPATQCCGDGQDVNLPPVIHVIENSRQLHHHKKCVDDTDHDEGDSQSVQLQDKTHHGNLFNSVKNLFLSHHVIGGSHVPISGPPDPTQGPILRSRSQGHLESGLLSSPRSDHHLHLNALSTWLACQVPPSLSRHSLHSHQPSDNMAQGRSVGTEPKGRESCGGSSLGIPGSRRRGGDRDLAVCGRSLPAVNQGAEDMLKQVVVKNQLLQASGVDLLSSKPPVEDNQLKDVPTADCALLPTNTSSSSADLDNAVPAVLEENKKRMRMRSMRTWMRQNRVFTLFLIGAFLIQLVCNVAILLAPSYAYQYDISKEEVATILSIYGVLNTVGRLVAGVLVYWGVGSLQVYNVGTLLSAVACFTFPLSTSFPTLALTLGLHGFFLGAFPPLQSVILVEYLGLHRLTSTFGIMCMVKAFASAAGAPLAGLLVTVTGTYTVPVVVCGGVLVLAAIVHQLMDC